MKRLVFVLIAVISMSAQDFRSRLNGTVLDSSGASVPKAKVELLNTETGVTYKSEALETGDFTIPLLPPGTYTATAEAPGFKKTVRDNIVLRAGQALSVTLTLSPGQVSEQITVTADSPVLETEKADRGTVIDTARITELPPVSRNPVMLSVLVAGVNFRGGSNRVFDQSSIDQWSVNGSPTVAAAPPLPRIRVTLVGDSTVNDAGGWGPGFRVWFGADVEVVNLAKNGRSSKSFRSEGFWEPALAGRPDYILIQFGHNDGPGKGPDRETDPKTTFRENMTRYIKEARAAGAQPILVTSIVRRAFTEDGKIKRDSLVPYVEAVRDLAAAQKVPLIDLYTLTLVEAEKAGSEGCAEIDARLPDGQRDRTHLGPKGRQEIGRMAAQEFVKLMPAMRSYAESAQQ